MSATPHQSKLEAAIGKLQAFCSTHLPLKSDEELARTFESFVVGTKGNLELPQNFTTFEEVLPVLRELESLLKGDRSSNEAKGVPQADVGNRLFASVKRNPE